MATTMNKYEGPGEVTLQGRTLAEATSVSVDITPNSTPVRTMKKGLAGRSRGPVESTIRVDNAVPKAGLEGDFIALCMEDADVTIVAIIGGKRYAFDGYITNVSTSNSTNGAASASFSVMAGKPRRA